ncbi:MAG: LysE family translocator [Hyphomicrobiaceae bacterium]|nr:LysE family translocator [Hyphomicrobiaceae bacterium]
MTFETWTIFVPAAFAMTMFPGPNNVQALTNGARHGFSTAVMAASGRFPAFALFVLGAAVGLGALLATSAELFNLLKIIGAGYLVWLGVQMFRSGTLVPGQLAADGALWVLVRREFLTAITNPKGMLVFSAFFAPFVSLSEPAFGQILTLGTVTLGLEFVTVLIYAYGGSHVGRLTRSPRGLAIVNRVSGSALIAAGVALLFARQPAQA